MKDSIIILMVSKTLLLSVDSLLAISKKEHLIIVMDSSSILRAEPNWPDQRTKLNTSWNLFIQILYLLDF